MISLASGRSRVGWCTSLLAVALTIVQACQTSPPTRTAEAPGACTCPKPNAKPSGNQLPPTVRGRARWFTQSTLVSFDIQEAESAGPASVDSMDIYWQVRPGAPNYPSDPQFPDNRTLGYGASLTWTAPNVFAFHAYIADPMNHPTIQVQVVVTDSSNTKTVYHYALPVDEDWHDFGSGSLL